MIEIRKAGIEELSDIMKIYDQGRRYMSQEGNPTQWGISYPPCELVEEDISRGATYVCTLDGEIGAVFYFNIGEDPCYYKIVDGEWRNDRAYAVVHRIAVGDEMRRHGVASKCIDYAVARCREAGIYDLRMDTHKENIPMQRFLEKCDFRMCGKVYVEDGSERIAYHKIIIKNIIFDVGQVLLEFDWRKFIKGMNIGEEKEKKLSNVTLGNIPHWNHHDRGMYDDEFIKKSLEIEPDIETELTYYMANIGTCAKEFDYAVPLIRELKANGYGVYILSNYGRTPFQYAKNNMKFFDEVDGMIISHEVGLIKPEPEMYELLYRKYNLVAGECVFLDDREDNIEAAIEAGMSGVVFRDVRQALADMQKIINQTITIDK